MVTQGEDGPRRKFILLPTNVAFLVSLVVGLANRPVNTVAWLGPVGLVGAGEGQGRRVEGKCAARPHRAGAWNDLGAVCRLYLAVLGSLRRVFDAPSLAPKSGAAAVAEVAPKMVPDARQWPPAVAKGPGFRGSPLRMIA
jgi:hypothetical protein